MAIIPQDPFLFSGTIRENLDPCGRHPDEPLLDVLEQCHLSAVVSRMGERLRQGVRQGVSSGMTRLRLIQLRFVYIIRHEASLNVCWCFCMSVEKPTGDITLCHCVTVMKTRCVTQTTSLSFVYVCVCVRWSGCRGWREGKIFLSGTETTAVSGQSPADPGQGETSVLFRCSLTNN